MRRAALVLLAISIAALCPARDLIVWGMASGSKGQEAIDREFERRHPGVRVEQLRMTSGAVASQKLLASIVGGAPPDVVLQDRFALAAWASRGAYQPLDSVPGRFLPEAMADCRWRGRLYGIPIDADTRALYWNRAMFRAAGLDPNRPPRNWDELLATARVLTRFEKDGALETAGFIPNFGNAWLFLYAIQNGASFRRLDEPATIGALAFMRQGYDALGGYENALRFESGFLTKASNPFFSGRLAMMIDGDWTLTEIARYAPGLDFGVTAPPRPRGSSSPATWSGGFCLSIPVGAKHPEEAREYLAFAASTEGQLLGMRAQATWERRHGRVYVPKLSANLEVNEAAGREFHSPYDFGLAVHRNLLATAAARPSSAWGQALWDEQIRAMDRALYHKQSPRQALQEGELDLERSMADSKPGTPIDTTLVVTGFSGFAVIAGVLLWILLRRMNLGPLARKEARTAAWFLSPWLVGVIGLTLGPMLVSLFWSFTRYSALSPPEWVGFRNFSALGGSDAPTLYKAFFNSGFVATFGVPLTIATSLAIALLLQGLRRGRGFFRTMFSMPAIVSGIATAVVWGWLLMPDPRQGLVNGVWASTITPWLGLSPPGWMASEPWAKHTLILMGIWGSGSGILLWIAGLNTIPKSLYESASIDGASVWHQFWRVTVPQLSPLIFFMAVVGFIGSLQEFDQVYVLKGSDGPIGPADSLLTPVFHLFQVGFGEFRIGYASAIAWALFAIIAVVTLIQFRLARHWVEYEAEV